MDKNIIIGVMTALITPFKNGKSDEQSYARLIQGQIDNGIDAVISVGTTGENATLTHEEHRTCIEIAVDICRGTKVKVLAGAGSNAIHEAVDLIQFAKEHGADGILSVTPYYSKPTQQGFCEHYKAIANSVDIPILLYNVPGRTGCEIYTEIVIKLSRDCEDIYGVKEANENIDKCVDLLVHESRMILISGEDAVNYPILSNGGEGVIPVTSNLLPDMISKLTHLASEENYKEAKKINGELYNINKTLFCENNSTPIKTAMYITGLIESLEFRLPLCSPSKENFARIEEVTKKHKIKGF